MRRVPSPLVPGIGERLGKFLEDYPAANSRTSQLGAILSAFFTTQQENSPSVLTPSPSASALAYPQW